MTRHNFCKPKSPLWSSSMVDLEADYAAEFVRLNGDIQGRLASQAYLNASTALYQGEIIGMGFLPKLYDTEALNFFADIVNSTYGILEKMTLRFINDPEYRALFRFSSLLEHLILLPSDYDCTIPIARIDIFLDENTGMFKFCEFNTDGTSAMNEDKEIGSALATSPTLKRYANNHTVEAQELFDTWVSSFIDLYYSSAGAVPDPLVAIVDYVDTAAIDEQLEFRERFAHQGINCLVADVRSLSYINGVLYAKDISKSHPAYDMPMRVDAIYRRVVTHDLLHDLEKQPPEVLKAVLRKQETRGKVLHGALALLAAVVNQKVCLIGGFKTQVAHSKTIFCMLHHPQTAAFLSKNEQEFIREHVPFTTWLKRDSIDIEAVKAEPARWIIKPVDGYGTQGVHAGQSFTPANWSTLIDEKLQEDYIAQEYCPQYQTPNTLPVPKDSLGAFLFDSEVTAQQREKEGLFVPTELALYNTLTGLYSYRGKLAGIYVRGGQDALIVGFRGGVSFASLLVDVDHSCNASIKPRTVLD